MKAKELSKEVYHELVGLPYSRKVNYFGEVDERVDFNSFSADVQEAIMSFPGMDLEGSVDLMGIDTLDGEKQFYVFYTWTNAYLVDTQGYTYPRYITQLENFLKK